MTKHRVLWLTASLLAVGVVASAAFAIGLWRDARALQALQRGALSDLENGRWDEAESSLRTLSMESRRLSRRLAGPVPRVMSIVPVAGRTVRTARTVLDAGASAAEIAEEALPVLREQTVWQQGRIDLAALRALRSFAAERAPEIERLLAEAKRTAAWPLPRPVADARSTLVERLESAVGGLEISTRAIDLSERVLGGDGRRRYFIAFENPAELRGAGGMWANYGILVADEGRLSLGRFGRVEEIARYATNEGPSWYHERYDRFGASHDWRQMTTAPDFPTVASMAEANLRNAEGIGPVDGTIAIDPVGIAALLRITGPVRVASWPEPIDASNVVKATLHDAYSHFTDNADRIAFLGDAAHAVWSRLLATGVSSRGVAASGLGDAIDRKHLRLHFTRPEEQRLAEALDATGHIGDASTAIGLVTQNTSGHKMDFWLKRRLHLEVNLHDGGGASVDAMVTLRNGGPASGEPRYVIGPFDERFRRGWNVQLVRLYLPATSAVLASRADRPRIAAEQGFVVVEWKVEIPPGETVRRRLSFEVESLWDPKIERLRLTLRRQAFLAPDTVSASIAPPWGRRMDVVAEDPACTDGKVVRDVHLDAKVTNSMLGWIVGPWARDARCGPN